MLAKQHKGKNLEDNLHSKTFAKIDAIEWRRLRISLPTAWSGAGLPIVFGFLIKNCTMPESGVQEVEFGSCISMNA
jgi:hypothetical protein